MAKQIIEDRGWRDRIDAANRYYEEWEKTFKCDLLEKYYEGFQWRNQKDIGYRPYVFNAVMETIQIKVGQYVPMKLKYELSATLGNADYDIQAGALSAKTKEDVLNTVCSDQKQNFHDELEQAYKDHFFRFGMIEVGYESDWIINPHAPRPGLDVDQNPEGNKNQPRIKFEPPELPVNERVYFKHVLAKRFRIGGMDHRYLDQCTWCGYYEWVPKEDLLAIKGLMNMQKVHDAVPSIPESTPFTREDYKYKYGEVIKIWHIWHNKFQLRLIVLDSPCVTIYQKPFKRLNLLDYRPDKRVSNDGFYPIPPVFHWLSPQDEINETREQLRKHRRRFNRKFQILEGQIDDEEIEKFEDGEDGTLVKVKQAQAISAIDNPDLGPALDKAIITSSDDLNRLSRTSSEVRGVSDRTTATQANIINQQAQIGEDSDRDRIGSWYERIGREALLTIRDKFTIGIWAKMKQNPMESIFQTIQNQPEIYKWVTTEELNDNYDFKIEIDVTSLSPSTAESEKQNFLLFISLISQFPQLAMSPVLIRETAYRCNYRNEKAIAELQKMALLHQFSVMQQASQPQQPGIAQQTVAKQTPNSMERVRNQLQQQVGIPHAGR